jgi:hypothetical protein
MRYLVGNVSKKRRMGPKQSADAFGHASILLPEVFLGKGQAFSGIVFGGT